MNAIWRRTILLRDLSVENTVRLLNHLLDLRRKVLRVEPQDQYIVQRL